MGNVERRKKLVEALKLHGHSLDKQRRKNNKVPSKKKKLGRWIVITGNGKS